MRYTLLILLFLLPGIGHAAIARDSSATVAPDCISSLQTSRSFTYTMGSVSNGLLIVYIEIADTGNTRTVSSITYASASLTFIGRQNNGAGNRSLEMWYLLNPASGANTVAVTLSGAPASFADCMVASYSGVRQSGQPDASASSNTGTSPNTTNITTIANNAWIMGIGGSDGSTNTAGANTSIVATGQEDAFSIIDTNADQTPAGSKSMTLTNSGSLNAMFIASFAPFTSAVTTTTTSILGLVRAFFIL